MNYKVINSPLGKILIAAEDSKLKIVSYLGGRYYAKPEKNWKKTANDKTLNSAEKQLREYFSGKRQKFNLPFDLAGTNFQVAVWKELSQIKPEQTTSYAKLAKKINKPRAYRAVGNAVGKNPICIIIPCHRVIAANNELGGYSGGIERKRKLLKLEKVTI